MINSYSQLDIVNIKLLIYLYPIALSVKDKKYLEENYKLLLQKLRGGRFNNEGIDRKVCMLSTRILDFNLVCIDNVLFYVDKSECVNRKRVCVVGLRNNFRLFTYIVEKKDGRLTLSFKIHPSKSQYKIILSRRMTAVVINQEMSNFITNIIVNLLRYRVSKFRSKYIVHRYGY